MSKLIVIGDKDRLETYLPTLDVVDSITRLVFARGTDDDSILAAAADAEFIMADAISPVSAYLIENLPKLKLIHSEGVAYNAIDLASAQRRGIWVCNCKGVNAKAVAEQAIALMLACLRDLVNGDAAVRAGQQIQMKEAKMVEGITELGDCQIGFVGAGDIATATMLRLKGWGCATAYYKRNPLTCEDEQRLNTRYLPLEELLATSDIVSLNVPVTDETRGMADAAFFAAMRPGSILINTARGEIVDQEALASALISGHLKAAGLDTLFPEPVTPDHILLNLPANAASRIIFSPHLGGITQATFYRAHQTVWENIARVLAGETPINIVS